MFFAEELSVGPGCWCDGGLQRSPVGANLGLLWFSTPPTKLGCLRIFHQAGSVGPSLMAGGTPLGRSSEVCAENIGHLRGKAHLALRRAS